METTIKEAIPILHDMYNYYNDTDIDAYIGFDKEDNNAIEIALDTMRKYQQIEEIYKNWCYPTRINAVDAMNKLGEVLKDGKID